MKPTENIKRLIKNTKIKTNPAVNEAVLNNLLDKMDKSKNKHSADIQPSVWRIIMKSKITKFAIAAVIIIITAIGIIFLEKTTKSVWAVSQTIEALKNIQSATAVCRFTEDNFIVDANIFIKADPNKEYSFDVCGESDQYLFMIRDNIAYQYEIGSDEIYSTNLNKNMGMGPGSKLWCSVIKKAPWIIPIAPNLIEAFKLLASDWQEIYQKDDQTGKDCVFVTGTYKPLATSFMMVFDLETKLIVRIEYWKNSNREGIPTFKVENIVYNTEIPDQIFDLEKTTGANVVNEEEANKRISIFAQGCAFDRKEQFTEAIKVYQQLYDEYPAFIKTPEALCMIAGLYCDMGQYDKAIEYCEKVTNEYSAPRYALLDAYRLEGNCYMKMGHKDKAIESLQNGLNLVNEWQNKSKYWFKHKELIEKTIENIKSNNQ